MESPTFAIVAACLVLMALGLVANYFERRNGKRGKLAFFGLAGAVAVFGVGVGFSAGVVSLHSLVALIGAAAMGVPFVFGAVTTTPVTAPSGQNPLHDTYVAQIAATADGDTAATVTHNFGLTSGQQPFTEVEITPMQAYVAAANPGWAVTARGANTVTITKNTATGSGLVGNQVEVRVKRPHTIGL